MIKPMSPTSKTTLLTFPTRTYLSDLQLAYDAKMAWVQKVNLAVTGKRPLSDEEKAHLRRLNELLAIGGFSPLEFE